MEAIDICCNLLEVEYINEMKKVLDLKEMNDLEIRDYIFPSEWNYIEDKQQKLQMLKEALEKGVLLQHTELVINYYRNTFFQLIDKEELCNITNDDKFWEKTRNYILENNKDKMGTFLREYISEFDFTNQNIYKIKKLVYGKLDKLKPLYFENICKTTGLIIFIIKDSFEYCGIIQNDKKTMPSIMINYLEYLQNNISRVKEYIDTLNQLFFNE